MTDPAGQWRRLDPRMLAVLPMRQLVGLLPLIVLVLVVGAQTGDDRVTGAIVITVLAVLAGVLRWFTTCYRITDTRVELRSGLLVRQQRSVPRDRVRSVDLTARPLHRIFGLTMVQVGTGQRTGSENDELVLDAVSAAEADRLRTVLLHRAAPADAETLAAAPEPPPVLLARLDWAWLRFAPLTASSLVAVGAVAGAAGQLLDEAGLADADAVRGATERLDTAPLWAGVTALVVLLLVIAVLGSLAVFVEGWWGYRLTREAGPTLRVRRGLLTTRSVSLEERRLRGVEVAQPLLLRAGRGARCLAVATGLGGATPRGGVEARGALLPPAPEAEAHRVAAVVLGEEVSPTRVALIPHPPAARRRRLLRAVLPVLVAAAVLELLGLPQAAVAALVLLVPAVLLAMDAYRALGHAVTGRYLVTRSGGLVRRTVALQRTGVIGWTVRQSVFQRRANLMTLTATTAAGQGAYPVLDVGAAEGLRFAEQAVPGLLGPFLEPAVASATIPSRSPTAGHSAGSGSPDQ